MKHRLGIWISTVSTILLVSFLFTVEAPSVYGNYRVRFDAYTVGLIVTMLCLVTLFIMILYTRAKNSTVAWFTALVSISIVWTFSYLMWAWAVNPQAASFWQHLAGFFWVPLPIIMLLFVVSYTTEEGALGHPLIWASMPVTVGLLVYIIGYSDALYTRSPINTTHHYWGIESAGGKYLYIAFAWLAFAGIVSFIMLALEYRHTVNLLRKKQMGIFLLAISVFLFAGLFFDVFYYILNVKGIATLLLPPMAFAYTGLMALIMGYGIIRYSIFKVNPASLSGTILENLSEAVVAVNNDLQVEFTNKGTELITGFKESILKGQHVSMLFDTSIFQQVLDKIKAGKDYFEFDDTLIKNNMGSTIPVTLSVGNVYDDRKVKAGHIFVFANISELKKKSIELADEKASVELKVRERTQELSEERARLSASINSLKLGYIMTGSNAEIIVMNPAAEALLRNLAEVQKMPAPVGWNLEIVQKILRAGANILDPIDRTHQDNKPFEFKEIQIRDRFLYVFVAPVTSKGKVIGSVVLFEDITDEKAVNRSKEEFFIIASHELRTPLTKIRGSAEIMQDVYKANITSTDALDMLNEIEKSSTHLIDIVNVIIEISELEQGKVTLQPEDFDLISLAKKVMEECQKSSGKSDFQTSVNSSLSQIRVVADKARTEQILRSFVINAFKFTDSGSVTINCKPEDHDIRVSISDTGKGIKEENRSLLFRKFQQAGSSLLSRDGEGTGLGLYVVKLIIRIMGGDAGLQSSEVGKGSTFYFTLPIRPVSQQKQPTERPLPKES